MATVELPETRGSTAILELFPCQGDWHESDYFSLPGNRIVELVDGNIEVPPMPSMLHQFLTRLVFLCMHDFVERSKLGIVMQAPTKVRIRERHFREPDVLFVSNRNRHKYQDQYWETIDLAVEVLSPDDPKRDLVEKRNDYARANILEYWIVDPRDDSIEVFELIDGEYRLTNVSSRTVTANSVVLTGLNVDVPKLFSTARSN